MAERDAAGAGGIEAERGSDSPDSDSDSENGGTSGESEMDFLRNLLSRTLGLGSEKPEKVLDELTLDGVSRFMQSEKCRNVVCLVGAGISTSAGIPDFRSPGTGLYANLQSYNLPYPEAIFEINYFKQHPEPFFALARELYPGQFKPTVCHYFIRLLKEKGLLLRCYTQNIDTLERVAGLDQEDLVEAHGTFFTSHCLRSSCRKQYTLDWMKEKIFSTVTPKCDKCQSLVKPDIVFFGESLPRRFFTLMQSDFQKVDLLIIMGTSLQVQPFASLVSRVPTNTPRLLINKEKTGQSDPFMSLMGLSTGMDFDSEKAYRDVAWLGECDEGCTALAELLGWKKELEELVKKEHSAIDAKSGQAGEAGASPSPPRAGATASPSTPPAKPGSSTQKESDAGSKAE
ncbi:NAD-dependent protein deacetylase sirtuin-2 [Chelonoidis abingdonii]|uniref:NAD-dependent protein deacetylase sirtuin-2 n=1 Tax=Chelonoidis abingdonii TaxID=106734 RepID=A0A8C0GQ71_CHEAB|nr:NAD-dependent protein deacetylase sirtuin-2 [Chelonoidis abingdonii]XP_032632165.1 NAD-dependent protein deacetylase sirtuin-2 [Chelonoidis abingdonii]